MKLLVFGATGATGQQVMEQALARGHQVTAVARRPEAIAFVAPHLRVVPGDVTQLASFQQHLAGQDAVIAALGTRGSAAPTTLYSVAAATMLQAMHQHGVRRLLTVTAGAYVQDEADPPLVRLVVKPVLTTILGAVYGDMQRMENLVRASSLDWTIVQPARLTNGPRTGRYRAVVGGSVPNGWQIARADVADYMLTHLDTPDAYRTTVALAY